MAVAEGQTAQQSVVRIFPITNYSFGTKEGKPERDNTVPARLERLKQKYNKEGIRHSVDAIVLVYEHGHPHILLFQVGASYFKLPGGRLRPGESDFDGLMRKLNTNMAPEAENMKPDWKIGECIGTYYRPNFENIMYPFVPPHIARPKEVRNLYLINLPEKCYFAIPKNYKLIAVPLFEIYDHIQRYGPVIASIPQMISRFRLIEAEETKQEDMDLKGETKEDIMKE